MKKIVLCIILFFSFLEAENQYQKISCVLHVHSNFSSGKNSVEEVVDLAKQHNIDCVIMADHLFREVEYGLWPFRRIVKKSVSLPSVMKNGVDKYLSKIEVINKIQTDVILISGVEITPHYFWSIEEGTLVVNNLHKHMLVLGINNKKLFYSLPVIGNELTAGKIKILSFWPAILLFLGIFLKSKLFVILSIIFMMMNYPFKYLYFDQYKNFFEFPYQNLINYVTSINSKNFITPLIIWAHPEAINYEKRILLKKIRGLSVYTCTKPYYESLLKTYDYDGFAIFAEGYREVGSIGGIWDRILNEYCRGIRKKPVFCYSEVDYGESLDELFVRKNIVYLKQKDYKNVLVALKNGNFYALWRDKEKELVIKEFKFCDEDVLFGSTYTKNVDKIKIKFKVCFDNNAELLVKVFIIKNGEVVFEKESVTPQEIFYEEEKPKTKSYYRIFIQSSYPHMLATNPIFVN